ncbi:MAG: DUF5651 domain-containing protein [Clostridia bacterium]|nr:DUF5651 domain-containing protein [Clostridia bacterium]
MQDYLNSEMRNQMMVIGSVIKMMEFVNEGTSSTPKFEDMAESWSKRGVITREERKNLKTAATLLKKFWNSVYDRMGKKEQEMLTKKLLKYDFRLIDDFTLQKVYRDMKDSLKYATMPREDFYTWCEEIMEVKCKNCTCDWKSYKLHDLFDDNFTPESTWKLPNCRYAYGEIKKVNNK